MLEGFYIDELEFLSTKGGHFRYATMIEALYTPSEKPNFVALRLTGQ